MAYIVFACLIFLLLLNRRIIRIMATLADLQSAFQAIRDDVSAVAAKLTALQDQVNQGVPVTQEQLDALVTDAQAIDASLKAL